MKVTEDKAKQVFEDEKIPEKAAVGMPAFAFYAEVDMTKQPLNTIKPFETMVLYVPSGLPSHARECMIRLFRCFSKQKEVSEGLIGDVMFGFSQNTLEEKELPATITWTGLCQLRDMGYIKFQAPDGEYIDQDSDKISSAWVRYQPKLLEMIYERA